jgi:hypothetical protein
MRTDRTGSVRLRFVPRPDTPTTEGLITTERPTISASISMWDLASSRYDLPASTRGFFLGTASASRTLKIKWRASNAFWVRIVNEYDARLPMGPLGLVTRDGWDEIDGTLARQRDGTYRGVVYAYSRIYKETLRGLGQSCQGESSGTQNLLVIGQPMSREEVDGAAKALPKGLPPPAPWVGSPNQIGGYLRLEFYVRTPANLTWEFPCPAIDEWFTKNLIVGDYLGARDGGRGPGNLGQRYLPFKDPRWAHPELGLVIPIPPGAAANFQQIEARKGSLVGSSYWYVSVYRGGKP